MLQITTRSRGDGGTWRVKGNLREKLEIMLLGNNQGQKKFGKVIVQSSSFPKKGRMFKRTLDFHKNVLVTVHEMTWGVFDLNFK